jgi:cytochrome c553
MILTRCRKAQHFAEMCAQCHGAPGREPDEIAQQLWPKAPNLVKAAPDWTRAQLFWITKNGIKFSAMPSWGPTYSDEKIWDIVLHGKMPNMSPEEYRRLSGGGESANTRALEGGRDLVGELPKDVAHGGGGRVGRSCRFTR